MKAPLPLPGHVITEADYAGMNGVEAQIDHCAELETRSSVHDELALKGMKKHVRHNPMKERAKSAASEQLALDIVPDEQEMTALSDEVAELFEQAKRCNKDKSSIK
jgi:hypothetical protein